MTGYDPMAMIVYDLITIIDSDCLCPSDYDRLAMTTGYDQL